MRFTFNEMTTYDIATGDILKPYKYYYLVRAFNRAAIQPREVVPFEIDGESLTQYGFVTKGPYSYYVVLINHIKSGNTDLNIDLSSLGVLEGKAWIRLIAVAQARSKVPCIGIYGCRISIRSKIYRISGTGIGGRLVEGKACITLCLQALPTNERDQKQKERAGHGYSRL